MRHGYPATMGAPITILKRGGPLSVPSQMDTPVIYILNNI